MPQFERRWKTHYRAWRRVGLESRAGIPYPPSGRSALDDDDEERSRVYEAAWRDGGLMFGTADSVPAGGLDVAGGER